MRTLRPQLSCAVAVLIALQAIIPAPAQADHIFGRLARLVHESTYHGKEPETCEVGAIEDLAENIDWLEHHIDRYGSVVAKQPDIWGEARLTKHRDEYERVMFGELGGFDVRLNAAITSSDGAFLAQALALSAAATGGTSVSTAGSGDQASATAVVAQLPASPEIKADFQKITAPTGSKLADAINIEPTTQLDQHDRYLQHLHELRRINEGDDTSDSPGYSLNLVRIPVSILPGKMTREGFGAEVTVTATPVLSDDLMPTTFRNLAVNDIAKTLRLPLVKEAEKQLYSKGSGKKVSTRVTASPFRQVAARAVPQPSRQAGQSLAYSQIPLVVGEENLKVISQEFTSTYMGRDVRWNGCDSCPKAEGDCRVDLLDMQKWLTVTTSDAYDLLAEPAGLRLMTFLARPEHGLGEVIRGNQIEYDWDTASRYRSFFFHKLRQIKKHPVGMDMRAVESGFEGCSMNDVWEEEFLSWRSEGASAQNAIEALAWALVVEAALLNDRLNEDVRKLAEAKSASQLLTHRNHLFFLPSVVTAPNAGLEDLRAEYQQASEVFQEYVRVRWPIHVFAIDPSEQDQNVADASRRKRELQFALAVGFVSGKIGGNSLTQYSRELQTTVETISLNRTIVGFGHGADTFGWRFYPRVQALDTPGTFGSIRQTLMGVSRDDDLKHRKIESGQRECTAVVLMPSFIPYADFDVRTNWFKLTNPKNSALTMKDSVRLSRAIASMHRSRAQCAECQHQYLEGEVDRLMARVRQLERELPLQSMRAQVPYENTLGGFEMFNTGVTDLSPELIGWYGAPGVVVSDEANNQFTCGCANKCPDDGAANTAPLVETVVNQSGTTRTVRPYPICNGEGTTLFLVGDNFSVHDTKVIAGGVCIPHVQLVSRDIMRVTIPSCVNTVKLCENGKTSEYVAVYAATPYGVTNHLHVPVHGRKLDAPTKTLIAETIERTVKSELGKLKLAPVEVYTGPVVGAPTKILIEANCLDDTSQKLYLTAKSLPAIAYRLDNPTYVGNTGCFKGSFYDGEYRTGLFPIQHCQVHHAEGVIGSDSVQQALCPALLNELAVRINHADVLDDGKHTMRLRLFYVPSHAQSGPMISEISVEIILAAPCCNTVATANGSAPPQDDTNASAPAVESRLLENLQAPLAAPTLQPNTPQTRQKNEELPPPRHAKENVRKPASKSDCNCVVTPRRYAQQASLASHGGAASGRVPARFVQEFVQAPPANAIDASTEKERFEQLSNQLQQVETRLNARLDASQLQQNALRGAVEGQQAVDLRAAARQATERLATAGQEQSIVNVNVRYPNVAPVPPPKHDWLSTNNHPIVGQMKTRTMETWRNVRDQLPCY
ncbi:hypothetical protein Mal64_32570 [Pseudobythopirellula maris]|uniref:IPT/TIG domain-containing protein n=1 Tax=Pseudobythopirellula maris TaxID=2527991 RepID=A0A5C5ZJX4_9BACT|nr:hypothetical protein [Pseudobythopirellula maris]TWT87714.1 hypothetical protein Mal64_32570 [Pseudobythopirellula maris]